MVRIIGNLKLYEDLSDDESETIKRYIETQNDFIRERQLAYNKLNELGANETYTDHKEDWND